MIKKKKRRNQRDLKYITVYAFGPWARKNNHDSVEAKLLL